MTTEPMMVQGNGQTALLVGETAPMMSLDDIQRWAKVFMASGLFKDTTDLAKAVVKIQAGQEIGVGPFAAMDGIDIIDGRLAPNAGLTAALIKRSGRYNFVVVESSPAGCLLRFTDYGQVVGEVGFTAEDAKRAGLTGKQNWTKWPEDMMFARALTRGARRFCADVFMGSVYTAEELGGEVDVETGEILEPLAPYDPPARSAPAPLTSADPAWFEKWYGKADSHAKLEKLDKKLAAAPDDVRAHPLVQAAQADANARLQQAEEERHAALAAGE